MSAMRILTAPAQPSTSEPVIPVVQSFNPIGHDGGSTIAGCGQHEMC